VSGTDPSSHRPVVTIAALYGADGSEIGQRVAEALAVPFLDRAIPRTVAALTGLSERTVDEAYDGPRTALRRAVDALGRAPTVAGGVGGNVERLDVEERALRAHVEEVLARATHDGGVVLGRGGMVVLRTVPWALHVHLGGPREERVARRIASDRIDRATAEARQRREDHARISYVRRAYGVDGEDPDLYHLMIDTIALGVDASVDLIVTAARRRASAPTATPPI
jgi:cytidylate kinase